ncbi:LemA family protein [Phyllobacterium phragmitis]|uniref:LemA family protein n=1 Tax=Phyllobacterium phragmitis TaxID=2670329 RepID=A0A2S9ITK7_9HYPH|nr:LemA family protein [Phyllobacterium phragmitis]PRD43856.1 LemA family protein [Phyllobacterium phragmitis]
MSAVTTLRLSGRRLFPALLLVMLVPLLSACGFNTIPTQEQQVKAAWSEVLNQYQRRTDLIPNLVATVQGYATHEKDTLTAVVDARAKATQVQLPPEMLNNPELFKQFQQNQANLSGALSRLLAVVENYPNLKANQNFLALQSQLEGTENRIAVARRDYIEAVRVYNTSLQTLPTMLWKLIWFRSNQPMPTFTINEAAQQAPKVNFN